MRDERQLVSMNQQLTFSLNRPRHGHGPSFVANAATRAPKFWLVNYFETRSQDGGQMRPNIPLGPKEYLGVGSESQPLNRPRAVKIPSIRIRTRCQITELRCS